MVANHASGQTTATFSNVAGPKTPLNYMGKECKKMAVLPPGAGLISCGVSIISIGDTVKISMLVDEAICDNPQEIIGLITETRAEILAEQSL